jgi:alkanesulfonate monooxygenase SsuD/methylene tetrahydromethanopterin reductase-like flavin-dependent oxidoreductase (luciferase family)/hemerythrin-like domain-containing protein
MADYGQDLQFGTFLTPTAGNANHVVELALLADAVGLDLVTVQDHPYQKRFLDTWTLLSVIAAQTSAVRVAPNVANLPLRLPAVLARSVASLDILSNGRVELGLGAGAFWDAIAAMGGPRRSAGEAVDALADAIKVIRSTWRIGPPTVHPVEIWLGSYKPRMLALTGASADGWLPSMGYADPDAVPELSARIDEAAVSAGRSPVEIRRLYNINGSFGRGAGFLAGSANDWAEQLAELTLDTGLSSYLLGSDDPDDIRRFALEVAPAVRELVDAARGEPDARPAGPPVARDEAPSFSVAPTPDDGVRLSGERLWDESARPTRPPHEDDRELSAREQGAGQHLVDIHNALRAELTQLHDVIGQVARGMLDAGSARSLINTMTMRQNNWTLGAFCESYCRIVTGHHSLEDRSVFPHLRHRDPELAPVLDRLQEEHEVIADVLDRVDQALVALVSRPDGLDELRGAVELLSDTLLSHLSYEERELVEPLSRHGYY